MILIYTDAHSPRLEYVCRFIFLEVLGISFKITQEVPDFEENPVITYHFYSTGTPNTLLHMPVSGLLDETGICPLKYGDFFPESFLYPNQLKQYRSLGFDLFAAFFLLLSRHEEYTTGTYDKHRRFDPLSSVSYKCHFLHRPILDEWALSLKELIAAAFPSVHFPNKMFTFLPTYDIDHAYAFKHRNWLRTGAGLIKSILKKEESGSFSDRIKVLTGYIPDPFDTYDFIFEEMDRYSFPYLFFFLLGDYDGKYNTNLSPKNKALQKLIWRCRQKADTGIHPSYRSVEDAADQLNKEISRLESVTRLPVKKSRQHYLRFRLPDAYRILISGGIEEEYSMGYASNPGFRAGTCTPFYWFDLEENRETNLRIFPLTFMDVTFRDYMNLGPEESFIRMKQLTDSVKAVHGTCICLWHNESLSNYGRWKGWRNIYRQLLTYAS